MSTYKTYEEALANADGKYTYTNGKVFINTNEHMGDRMIDTTFSSDSLFHLITKEGISSDEYLTKSAKDAINDIKDNLELNKANSSIDCSFAIMETVRAMIKAGYHK